MLKATGGDNGYQGEFQACREAMPSHYVESLLGPMSECEGDQKSFP